MGDPVKSNLPPLNNTDYESINKDLRDLARIKLELDTAIAGGVPCEEQCQACQYLTDVNTKLKKAAFPHAP